MHDRRQWTSKKETVWFYWVLGSETEHGLINEPVIRDECPHDIAGLSFTISPFTLLGMSFLFFFAFISVVVKPERHGDETVYSFCYRLASN